MKPTPTALPPDSDPAEIFAVSEGHVERLTNGSAVGPQLGTARSSTRRRKSPGAAASFKRTDLGNAERLVAQHGAGLRFCPGAGGWLVWDGRRWVVDTGGAVESLATLTVRAIYLEAAAESADAVRRELGKHADASERAERLRAMIQLAEADLPDAGTRYPSVRASLDEFDADPMLFNCANGTLDLRTGELREHRQEDMITMMSPVSYDPDAVAPQWAEFLAWAQPDPEVRAYLQRFSGSTLTGQTRDQIMHLLDGIGANGKGVFTRRLYAVLGSYAHTAPVELFVASKSSGEARATPERAQLRGKRLVLASESEEGSQLAEALMKSLTGEDIISARELYKAPVSFRPAAKFVLSTNHKPVVRGNGHAIWRRMCRVPFTSVITDERRAADKGRLEADLLPAEHPGILAWMVRGCLAWQRDGLDPPAAIQRANAEYREEQDLIGLFLREKCTEGPTHSVTSAALYGEYKTWCDEAGERPQSVRRLGERLTERGGVTRLKGTGGRRGYLGIGLQWVVGSEPEPAPASAPEPVTSPTAPDCTLGPCAACPTCTVPGPWCGPGIVAGERDASGIVDTPCGQCGRNTLVRAACGTPRHADCRPPRAQAEPADLAVTDGPVDGAPF